MLAYIRILFQLVCKGQIMRIRKVCGIPTKSDQFLKQFLNLKVLRLFPEQQDNRTQHRLLKEFATIGELLNKQIDILTKLYNTWENVTIDEQLVAFKERFSFRQYKQLKTPNMRCTTIYRKIKKKIKTRTRDQSSSVLDR